MGDGQNEPAPTDHPAADDRLDGLRVLVVEDEFLVALALEDDLREVGCEVIGPFHDVASARDGVVASAFDLAVLDVNLNGVEVFPVAEELERRKVPYLFLTGYGAMNLPERFRGVTRVPKPYYFAQLKRAMRGLIAEPSDGSSTDGSTGN